MVGLGGSGHQRRRSRPARGARARRPTGASTGASAALDGVTAVDVAAARERVDGVELVAATDVDNPLTGLIGATKIYGPQKGISEERLPTVDGVARARSPARWTARLGSQKGAGAAGGLGFALLLLGATREPGIELVAEAVGLAERARPRPTWW